MKQFSATKTDMADKILLVLMGMGLGFALTYMGQQAHKRIQLAVCEETSAMHLPMKCQSLYYELGYTN
jgi:hypothetical protein